MVDDGVAVAEGIGQVKSRRAVAPTSGSVSQSWLVGGRDSEYALAYDVRDRLARVARDGSRCD